MPYIATTYNVMIASPGDVVSERAAIRQTLADWNVVHSQARGIVLLPIGWETHSSPQMGAHPQKILNKQILKGSDLLVGVFWTRLGTPTDTHASGSVEEIEEHISANKPTMLYFSSQPVLDGSVDAREYERLVSFREQCKKRRLYQVYNGAADFRECFNRQLQLKLNQEPYFSRDESSSTAPLLPSFSSHRASLVLSEEATVLLAAAAEGDGVIMHLRYLGGTDVQAGGKSFVEDKSQRAVARWEAAISELEQAGLIEDRAGKREVYFMTNDGFQVIDGLVSS
jgi:hypothetical protein